MNIFKLSEDTKTTAQMHCDKHLVKMILEYSQILSAAHRILDGIPTKIEYFKNEVPKVKVVQLLPGECAKMEPVDDVDESTHVKTFQLKLKIKNPMCYNLTHSNHPSTVWARGTSENYLWLASLLNECFKEYTIRYGKIHASTRVFNFLKNAPTNIKIGKQTAFALAMPDIYKVPDAVLSYQNYYIGEKMRFAKWTNRKVPEWFLERVEPDASHFERTR
jgi:hypothetical protein